MKYPQLVSTRAVNAISDWLVSRLEQLGVEAPQIYTRLLLSLLQSTIQLNDPIEFSNLESFFASRKGGNRRYQTCDIDALKKFNAVQCLKDIVSSEQEITTIENLVDELCEKLKDIEKQTGDSEDEDKLLVATLSLARSQPHHHNHHHHQSHHSHKSHHNHQTKEVPTHSKSCSASSGGGSSDIGKLAQTVGTASTSANSHNNNTEVELDDSKLDPLDRYCRAFPALSKEMEDSFETWRRNAKWLTWPVEQPNQDKSISSCSSSSTISSNSGADGDAKDGTTCTVAQLNSSGSDRKLDDNNTVENASKMARQELFDDGADINDNEGATSASASAFASANAVVGGIKRKSKRRRSQALSKGKTIQQNVRKMAALNTACGSSSASMQTSANAAATGRNKRSASPICWDTDFDGTWEMGHDLIKEFITRQNRNSRNRSTSESAVAYTKKSSAEVKASIRDDVDEGNQENAMSQRKVQQQLNEENTAHNSDMESDEEKTAKAATPVLPLVDISFCDYDEYDDTLASVSELTNDAVLATLSAGDGATALPTASAKRLYERELIPNNAKSDEQLDIAQFEAKFNSTVEALWKDASSDDEKGFKPIANDNKTHVFGFGSGGNTHFSGPTSLPFPVPFSQNLKNFWANYYNHHFDLSKMLGNKAKDLHVPMQSNANEVDGNVFKPIGGAPEKRNNFSKPQNIASATTSDYYSMPSNLNDMNKAKMRYNSDCSDNGIAIGGNGTIGEERKTPVALFLQNSIWSENANLGGGDTDESFYFKVHNSGKQLSQYDITGNKNNNNREEKLRSDGVSSEFAFATAYTASKWSEGINAGPPTSNMQQMPPLQQIPHKQFGANQQKNNFNIPLNAIDNTNSSSSAALATISSTAASASNWSLTKGNTKADIQNAWTTGIVPINAEQMRDSTAAQRMSTQIVGAVGGSGTAIGNSEHDKIIIAKPKVTLPNHSSKSSGFIEYSRIKSVLQLQLSTDENAQQQVQRNYPPRSANKEQQQRYALDIIDDGENLLTSERTHFNPIKSYVDGHTFDICSELDAIDYQRSASGYLYLEQDKYLEYTRTDNFIVEDDGGIGASANPLYANSNCEAATASAKANYNKSKREFVIKFRMQRTDIACQTDAEPPVARALSSASKRVGDMKVSSTAKPHPLCLIFSNAAKNLKATAANELVYSDTVEAFTRAIAHFPPPPPTANNSSWLPLDDDFGNRNWNIYQQQSKVQKKFNKNSSNTKSNNDADHDATGCDEIDFYGSAANMSDMGRSGTYGTTIDTDVDMTSLEQEWSMNEIRRKCKEAGHTVNYTNANNNNKSCSGGAIDGADGTIESVWGMCAACNSELKSIPADRLLRDELQVEADEIMSDLKYMQDLYIGSAGDADDADDEDDGCVDDDSGAGTVTSDSDWCAEDVTAEAADECADKPMLNSVVTNDRNEQTTSDVAGSMNDSNVANDSDNFSVIQKVNRLIAELLRPENHGDSGIQVDKLNANTVGPEDSCSAETESVTTQFCGNLWHSNNNERNIWQLNAADNSTGIIVGAGMGLAKVVGDVGGSGDVGGGGGIHPMQLLRQFNVKPIDTAVNIGNIFSLPTTADTDNYNTQMSWEHENLARIWQTSPSSPPGMQQHQQRPLNDNMVIKNFTSSAAAVNQLESHENINIAEKNMRNLRANADASVEAAAANLQQAQEFLSNNQSRVSVLTSAQLVDSALKLKAATRKRRHSASQNYFHAQLNGGATAAVAVNNIVGATAGLMHNNNNNEIANFNSYTLTSLNASNGNELNFQNLVNVSLRFGAAAAAAVAASNAKKCSNYASNLCGADIAYGCDATAAAARNHTIITCKYHVTAIKPLHSNDGGIVDVGSFDGNDGVAAAPLSSIIDKNQSILKHVAMVSRPLTR